MIDIHCHILPGIDDGSASVEDSVMMAELARDSGVHGIIATPHCNLPGDELGNYKSDELAAEFEAFRQELKLNGIKLDIYSGAEVFCTPDTPRLLRKGSLLTLADSRYLLVEFFFNESPEYIGDMLMALRAEGVVPVVAHPERYGCVQADPRLADRWVKEGSVIQVNKGSVLGRFGSRPQSAAEWLLTRGIVHAVGSDAHSPYFRTTEMDSVRHIIASDYGSDYADLLMEKNPQLIIRNKELIRV